MPQSETVVRDEPATFRSRVNLIVVPVVVRDRTGRPTGHLKIDDFQLTDNGKPQFITKFFVEKPGSRQPVPLSPQPVDPTVESRPTSPPPIVPERYTIYLFDDVHAEFAQIAQVRDAALRHFDSNFQPTDRAAIFTTSGQGIEDFTDDKGRLRAALMALRPRPVARAAFQECPDVTFYIANVIQNRNDRLALDAMIQQTILCQSLDGPSAATIAESIVRSAVTRTFTTGEHESRIALSVLKDAVRRLAATAGQRTIVLASPGFLTTTGTHLDRSDVIDRAIRANVIINTLDCRGLYTDPTFDASRSGVGASTALSNYYFSMLHQSASASADVLAEISYGTGGSFFQNQNDFNAAFTRLAAAPDFVYMLGFSPQNLRVDGRYHRLKVAVRNSRDLSLQARRGYFAPKEQPDPAETARLEIEEALFSREELRDIPITFHTQFFKRDDFNARLSVINRVDLRALRFRKADDRNCDDLTVVTAIFDRNGRFIRATRQQVQMRLLDQTVANKLGSPLSVRTSFDLQPGAYAVRVVVRDTEGQLMSAANGAIEIP